MGSQAVKDVGAIPCVVMTALFALETIFYDRHNMCDKDLLCPFLKGEIGAKGVNVPSSGGFNAFLSPCLCKMEDCALQV